MTRAVMDHEYGSATPIVPIDRMHRGRMSYHAGLAAEEVAARHFRAKGDRIAAQRWRGKGGEIDLIVESGEELIFVEVKKSRDFDTALSHITPAQVRRLYATGEEYLATQENGSLIDVRFDVVLVESHGKIEIIENAFGHLLV